MTERLDVNDIAPDQYAAWRNHPVTLFMFQFMTDFAKSIEEKMLMDWRAGTISLTTEQEAKGRIMALDEIPDLKWASIQKFYGIEPKQADEATEEENESGN